MSSRSGLTRGDVERHVGHDFHGPGSQRELPEVSIQCISMHKLQAGILRCGASVTAGVHVCTSACACSSGYTRVSEVALQLSCQLVVLLDSCQQPGVAA